MFHCLKNSLYSLLLHTLIYPYPNYCNVFGQLIIPHIYSHYLNLKKAVRVISLLPYYSHIGDSFKKLNIMSIYQIHFFQMEIFMYKYHHHVLPSIFDNYFTLNLLRPHDTRNWTPYQPDFARSNIKFHSIRCVGPRVFSRLPCSLFAKLFFYSFKKSLRVFISVPVPLL